MKKRLLMGFTLMTISMMGCFVSAQDIADYRGDESYRSLVSEGELNSGFTHDMQPLAENWNLVKRIVAELKKDKLGHESASQVEEKKESSLEPNKDAHKKNVRLKKSEKHTFTDEEINQFLKTLKISDLAKKDYAFGKLAIGSPMPVDYLKSTEGILYKEKDIPKAKTASSTEKKQAEGTKHVSVQHEKTKGNDKSGNLDSTSSQGVAKKMNLATGVTKKIDKIEKTVKGPFVTYSNGENSITVYEGPSWSERNLYPGLTYDLTKGDVVQIHVRNDKFSTSRHIKVGAQRGRVIVRYGAPQAIYRDINNDALVYLYQKTPKDPYIAFTMKGYKVAGIDIFSGALHNPSEFPNMTMRHFVKGKLEDADFVLSGYRINDDFSLKKGTDRDWAVKGRLWNDNFVASDSSVVLYDDSHKISHVFLGAENSVTRRGVGIGSNKILFLLTYGPPTKIYRHFSFAYSPNSVAYEYKNPNAISEYLIFIVNSKNNFVEALLLSDRPADTLYTQDDKRKRNLLLYNKLTDENMNKNIRNKIEHNGDSSDKETDGNKE